MQFENGYSRSVHYAKTHPNDVFAFANLLQFDGDLEDGPRFMSVASNRIAGSDVALHDYGCRTAAAKNEGFEERKGREPNPLPLKPLERVYYIGYYEFDGDAVLQIKSKLHWIHIVPLEEQGNKEHCEIQLVPRDDIPVAPTIRRERKRERMEIRDDLRDLLHGPVRHVCEGDTEHEAELSGVPLPDMPQPLQAA
jgi:hypothetical protein